MPRIRLTPRPGLARLLGLAALASAAAIALMGRSPVRPARSAPAEVDSGDVLASGATLAAGSPGALGTREAFPGPLVASALFPPPSGTGDVHAPLRGERELRAAYLRRQRGEPGWLEREAAGILASEGPAPEKVALLRALEDAGSAELVRWLEQAVLLAPDRATPEGESVPSFALARLQRRAVRDSAVREALLRLAFEAQDLAPAHRRRAAAAYAASCPADELFRLESRLARARDAELVQSTVLALRPRRSDPAAWRLLDLYDTRAAEPAERPHSCTVIE